LLKDTLKLVQRRIALFTVYQKPETNTYAFNKLPSAREWGVNRPFDDKSNLICKPGTNEPFIVWIVGRIARSWFYDKESNPASQVSVNIVPVNDPTGNTARQLLSQLSKPAIGMYIITKLGIDNLHVL